MSDESKYEWMSELLDGQLTGDALLDAQSRLDSDEAARRLFDDLQSQRESLQALPLARPGADFADRVLDRIKRSAIETVTNETVASGEKLEHGQPVQSKQGQAQPPVAMEAISRSGLNWRAAVASITSIAALLVLGLVVYINRDNSDASVATNSPLKKQVAEDSAQSSTAAADRSAAGEFGGGMAMDSDQEELASLDAVQEKLAQAAPDSSRPAQSEADDGEADDSGTNNSSANNGGARSHSFKQKQSVGPLPEPSAPAASQPVQTEQAAGRAKEGDMAKESGAAREEGAAVAMADAATASAGVSAFADDTVDGADKSDRDADRDAMARSKRATAKKNLQAEPGSKQPADRAIARAAELNPSAKDSAMKLSEKPSAEQESIGKAEQQAAGKQDFQSAIGDQSDVGNALPQEIYASVAFADDFAERQDVTAKGGQKREQSDALETAGFARLERVLRESGVLVLRRNELNERSRQSGAGGSSGSPAEDESEKQSETKNQASGKTSAGEQLTAGSATALALDGVVVEAPLEQIVELIENVRRDARIKLAIDPTAANQVIALSSAVTSQNAKQKQTAESELGRSGGLDTQRDTVEKPVEETEEKPNDANEARGALRPTAVAQRFYRLDAELERRLRLLGDVNAPLRDEFSGDLARRYLPAEITEQESWNETPAADDDADNLTTKDGATENAFSAPSPSDSAPSSRDAAPGSTVDEKLQRSKRKQRLIRLYLVLEQTPDASQVDAATETEK